MKKHEDPDDGHLGRKSDDAVELDPPAGAPRSGRARRLELLALAAAAAASAILGAGCCKTCPPPKVVVTEVREPCLEESLVRDLLPVAKPAACDAEEAQEACLAKGCLPGRICYDAAQHGALLYNVRTLLSRAAAADAACLQK